MTEAEKIEFVALMEAVMREDAIAEMANDSLLREAIAAENAADEAAEAQERAEAASADWLDHKLDTDPDFRDEMMSIVG